MDISVIIAAHNEGRLLHPTLESVRKAMARAAVDGITSEVIVVLDRADAATVSFIASQKDLVIETTSFADPGPARNRGVHLAAGRYLALLDGDDLMGENWLAAAFHQAEASKVEAVHYPEYVVIFGARDMLLRPRGTRHPDFSFDTLMEYNCWNSVHFLAPRSLVTRHPFCSGVLSTGFGYEDWHWYCEIVASGVEIETVPETCVFYRRKKSSSRLTAFGSMDVLLPPSSLFEPAKLAEIRGRKVTQVVPPSNLPAAPKLKLKQRLASMLLRMFDGVYARNRRPLRLIIDLAFGLYPRLSWLVEKTRRYVSPRRYPQWLLSEWRNIHEIEPLVFPDSDLLASIFYYEPPKSRIATSYLDLCRRYGSSASHVILVPWLKAGGADLEVLHYVRALADEGLANGVVVIATNDTDSPWANRLPSGVRFIEFGRQYGNLSQGEREQLLTRLWLQMQPEVVHNINSDVAYRILVRHGKALSSISRIFASTFCCDYSPEGKMTGYPFWYFRECFDYLSGVFCDNQTFIDHLVRLYALDPRKLHVHYQAFTLPISAPRSISSRGESLEVLWAGRLDRQKRPDILLAIVHACESLRVTFHVYGGAMLDDNGYYKDKLSSCPNLVYHGKFDGFDSIPSNKYDVFLNTSQWDGLPNILMEATAAGLPVITSAAGGIRELIHKQQSGFVVDPYDDVPQYVEYLRSICEDGRMLPAMVKNAQALVSERHTWRRFLEDLRAVPAYASRHAAVALRETVTPSTSVACCSARPSVQGLSRDP